MRSNALHCAPIRSIPLHARHTCVTGSGSIDFHELNAILRKESDKKAVRGKRVKEISTVRRAARVQPPHCRRLAEAGDTPVPHATSAAPLSYRDAAQSNQNTSHTFGPTQIWQVGRSVGLGGATHAGIRTNLARYTSCGIRPATRPHRTFIACRLHNNPRRSLALLSVHVVSGSRLADGGPNPRVAARRTICHTAGGSLRAESALARSRAAT